MKTENSGQNSSVVLADTLSMQSLSFATAKNIVTANSYSSISFSTMDKTELMYLIGNLMVIDADMLIASNRMAEAQARYDEAHRKLLALIENMQEKQDAESVDPLSFESVSKVVSAFRS